LLPHQVAASAGGLGRSLVAQPNCDDVTMRSPGHPGNVLPLRILAMSTSVDLYVYRRLDNRLRGEPDDSAFALELHERRRHALEDALGGRNDIEVLDWGLTQDSQSHELVELIIGAAGSAVFNYVMVPGLKLLGEKLIDLGSEKVASELVKAVVSRLRPKQAARELNDFWITLKDGTRIDVQPPDGQATITISAPQGAAITINYASESA
jgi:hypothetical protein